MKYFISWLDAENCILRKTVTHAENLWDLLGNLAVDGENYNPEVVSLALDLEPEDE